MGRFLTKDDWGGNIYSPISYNKWLYTSANPINAIDPSGHKEIVTHVTIRNGINYKKIVIDLKKRLDKDICKVLKY